MSAARGTAVAISKRVEVTDQGGPWTQSAPTDGQRGRGLLIVRELARDFGISSDNHTSRTVWFELTCPCVIPPGTRPVPPATTRAPQAGLATPRKN